MSLQSMPGVDRPGQAASAAGHAPSLTETAYRRLEEAIVTLSLRPGAVLTEAQMIDMVGVGRTPVREALIRLAQQGMVEILPRKGVLVAGIDAIDIMAALDAREVLERLIAADAAKRASPGERVEIIETARAMREAATEGDANGYMRL
ncbi:MAG: GntR family transcriptional regulator, partial [Microvirga sp.]